MLVENIFKKSKLTHSVIGVGLNVNQLKFENLPKAGSIKSITGRAYDIDLLMMEFENYFHHHLDYPSKYIDGYKDLMFRYGKKSNFMIKGNTVSATVSGTDRQGKLLLLIEKEVKAFDLKEVEWLY